MLPSQVKDQEYTDTLL